MEPVATQALRSLDRFLVSEEQSHMNNVLNNGLRATPNVSQESEEDATQIMSTVRHIPASTSTISRRPRNVVQAEGKSTSFDSATQWSTSVSGSFLSGVAQR